MTLSPTVRSSDPPQVLHTPAGTCTTSRRGSSGGSWRRFFFWPVRDSAGAEPAGTGVRRVRLGLLRLRCNRLGLRRLGFLQRQLELFESALDPLRARPNFSRLSLAIWAFSFSIVSCVMTRPFLAAASSAPARPWQPAAL